LTPDKAIKFLDEEIVRLDGAPIINGYEMTDDWRGHLEICKLAKEALEKQIPKKPLQACGHATDKTMNYCPVCGQALDWSETEG
jgi:RNA polymerase subunit RPABC4/transcription elongation factor Spt4